MDQNTTTPTTPTRPGLLTVLCILTFIANGLGALVSVLVLLAAGTITAMLPSSLAGMFAGSTPSLIVMVVCCLATLYGAMQMWKLKKMGFYIYTGAQVVALVAPLMFGQTFSVMSAVFAAVFIVLYYLNVKHMN